MERAAYERLRWRCSRRAMLEMDLLLTRFLETEFSSLSPEAQAAFVEMADLEDRPIWLWISGQESCPRPDFAPLIARLQALSAARPT
ncbi:MAG: succinate dehydrogenase assembly factor 2 [Zoogloeaceae bacterium]|jgi:succinate dehydrogenase / fumarate reductase iron-sulfur subunit/antitoxin CptB|nr:succinate dehydrogenase assembly factor 2 [Zoogloeaceae bacterium]